MIKFGIKAAHEQFSPTELLKHTILAEKVGFDTVWASDHFHPWAHTNAHSGFTWIWMASVAENTKKVKIGTGVTAPTFRYHPALVAQAFATLDYMYPGRIRLGVGIGEALNEVPLGYEWPPIGERIKRLIEAIKIIKSLWEGNFITFKGNYYRLKNAKLYTTPKTRIPLYVAAFGSKMSYLAGKLGDGFYTAYVRPRKFFEETTLPSLRKGIVESGRNYDQFPKVIEIPFSFSRNIQDAYKSIRFWGGTLLPIIIKYDIHDPREIEECGLKVSLEAMRDIWVITNDPDEIIGKVEEVINMGFNEIVFMSSSPNQEEAIKILGKEVIPYFREK